MNAQVQAQEGTNLDSLLAMNLDDVADLPTFDVPPAGYYKLALDIEVKKINEKDAVVFKFAVLETLELADATAAAPVNGTKFDSAFMITNSVGLGKFKEAAKPIMAALGTTTFSDILGGQVKGMEVFAVLKRRQDKNDPEKVYPDVSKITVA